MNFFPVIPNPQSLAQALYNDIKFLPDLGYKMINIVLWSPLRQGGPKFEMCGF